MITNSRVHDKRRGSAGFSMVELAVGIALIGASMGAYTAIRLTETFSVDNLILLVPAVYTPQAYETILRFCAAGVRNYFAVLGRRHTELYCAFPRQE